MLFLRCWMWGGLCALICAAPSLAATLTLDVTSSTVLLGGKVWFTGKLDGKGIYVDLAVNGIPGGNASVGKVNSQNGLYEAPAVMPSTNPVTVTATSSMAPQQSASVKLTLVQANTPPESTAPSISGVSPLAVGCGPYMLTVSGSRFTTASVVRANGVALSTAYVSDTRLTASGTATQAGPLPLEVVNGDLHSSTYTQVQVGTCGSTGPIVLPPVDLATVAASRFLEQATFGTTPADLALVKQIGPAAWLAQQLALPASTLPVTSDMNTLRKNWYANMASAPDQVRQRMIFALSQIFVVSADKNNNANEMQPWLTTLSNNALGNYGALLREMSLNPSMGKYLDMGNSVIPAPNENYAREVMQLFTLGPNLLNQDGSLRLDPNGNPIPTYDQARIVDFSRALSGWTYTGASATGLNWENFSGPLQPRDKYHDKGAKTLLQGVTLPANQTAQQDFDAVMQNLFLHPNLPPFVATRLIRAFVTSNPSPAYIKRVADVFANGSAGRGDLRATLTAVLLDPEARSDAVGSTQGRLKDSMLHTLSLVRALGGTVIDPSNLFWDYFLMNQKILNAPSVFNFYSPMTRLPGAPQLYGPEFQIYAPSLAVARANFIYALINGDYKSMIAIDISPYVNAAGDAQNLINLVDANLMQGRMSVATAQAIAAALAASTDNRQRAITALYLTAISAEFAVNE